MLDMCITARKYLAIRTFTKFIAFGLQQAQLLVSDAVSESFAMDKNGNVLGWEKVKNSYNH